MEKYNKSLVFSNLSQLPTVLSATKLPFTHITATTYRSVNVAPLCSTFSHLWIRSELFYTEKLKTRKHTAVATTYG